MTPRLDGTAWFEKPPLLYWMIAAGNALRLPGRMGGEAAGGAAESRRFCCFSSSLIAREFTTRTAIAAVTILSTTAGWLAYSFVALTDLPMSAMLGAAMLVMLFEKKKWSGFAAGALLGLAVLAKAFVPLVLFAPVFLIARGRGRRLPWD